MKACKRLSEWLIRASRWWVALAAVVIFALFVALVLPAQSQGAEPAESDAGSPDLSIYYSASDLYEMAEAYGPDGRREYIRARFTFDVAWPAVYGVFLVAALSWLVGRAFAVGSPWRLLNLLPLASVALDFAENVLTSVVMARFPARTPVVDGMAGVATALKWALLGASFVALLVLLVVTVWQSLRRRTPSGE